MPEQDPDSAVFTNQALGRGGSRAAQLEAKAIVPVMDRRAFITLVGGSILAAPLAGEPQQAGKIPRIGLIMSPSESMARGRVDAFRQALHEFGFIEGRTVAIEYHYLDGRWERVPTVVTELLRSDVNVIVAHGTPQALAAKQATSVVPIVMWEVGDPVGSGLVPSLARPGGNLTGVAQLVAQEIYGKQLQILTELIPGLSRVALLANPGNVAQRPVVTQAQAGATALGLTLVSVNAQSPDELDRAVLDAVRVRAAALVVSRDALFFSQVRRLVDLTAVHRLPTMYGYGSFAEAGGLIGYGPDPVEIARRTAALVAKILKGTKPADLPVEQPTKFEMVINLKTAKALGLTIPQSLLLRADQVIE